MDEVRQERVYQFACELVRKETDRTGAVPTRTRMLSLVEAAREMWVASGKEVPCSD